MNALYPAYKAALLVKGHDMAHDAIRAALIDSGAYVYSPAHVSYSTDVSGLAKIAESAPLSLPTTTNGVFDTADFTWAHVGGPQAEAIILWNDTPPTKPLVAFYDSGMSGMPVTPTGVDISVTVNLSGWFAL
jgi:hypothetical protein